MRKLSLRNISILGLVLMAASAVTAAMVPNKSDKKPIKVGEGSLTRTSDDGDMSSVTCNPDSNANISQCACTATSQLGGSGTTTMSNNPYIGTSDDGNESDEEGRGIGQDNTTDCD